MKNYKNDISEVTGGRVDNSYDAPLTIKSKNIESFRTEFYFWNPEAKWAKDVRDLFKKEDKHYDTNVDE